MQMWGFVVSGVYTMPRLPYSHIMQDNTYKRIAQACGLLPLTAGIIFFALWWFTDNFIFVLFGVWTILIGLGLLVIGFVFLGIYYVKAKPKFSALLRPIGILLFPIPVAAVVVAIGASTMFSHRVTVISQCPQTVLFEITDPSWSVFISEEGTSKRHKYWGEGPVLYIQFVDGVLASEGVLIGYITSGMGSDVTIFVDEMCDVRLHNSKH